MVKSNQQQGLISVKRQVRTSEQLGITDCDQVIAEQAVALVYNGISHAVMMATPVDLLDFALGFSLAEQIISQPSDILDHEIVISELGVEVKLSISSRLFVNLKTKRRSLAGNSGCGLCGVESLQQTQKQHRSLAKAKQISFNVVTHALAQFQQQQVLNNQAGAVHGAAFCSLASGEIICLREDVGRHNALDKLIGALARTDEKLSQGFILVSSRASYEMVDKTIAAGINHLVTMSAATSKAIDWAKQHNLNLIGFARDNRQVLYVNG